MEKNNELAPPTVLKRDSPPVLFSAPSEEFVMYRVEQKTLARFSDTYSVRADGLSIGCFKLVGRRRRKIQTCKIYFAPPCTTPLYGSNDHKSAYNNSPVSVPRDLRPY